jgi:trk system potassium uptake protein TrkA
MRAVFVGAGTLALTTARYLLKRGHEVVIIERDRELIDELASELDCGFLHGDGSKPALLREADPDDTDVLFCLTGNDQANILASLVGRSLGFERVVTQIVDPEFEHICIELGLEDTIIPARTIGLHLADMFEGRDPLELSTIIRDDARAFSFVADEDHSGPIADLDLPEDTRVICLYRNDDLILPERDTRLRAEDEVVCLAHRDRLAELEKRFNRATGNNHRK